jgi:DNA-binding transcriptional regulator GbsR (MarR family)
MLEDKGFIERVSRPGDRRDYYRIASNLFVKTMEQRLSRWERVREAVG